MTSSTLAVPQRTEAADAGAPHLARSRVLVALDGSPAAATALPVARQLASQLGVGLEVLHVERAGESQPDQPDWLQGSARPPADLVLCRRTGDPAEEILRESAAADVAFIVLATHGRQIEPGRQLGHVAEAVVRDISRPVLLVRPEAAAVAPSAPGLLWRLLLPLDGAPVTSAALRPVFELAGRLGAAVDILYIANGNQHVIPEPGSFRAPRYVDQPQHEWPLWRARVLRQIRACLDGYEIPVPVRIMLKCGVIEEEIARHAREHGCDAIAVVRRSHLEPGRAPVLRAVLSSASVPVLLVGGAPALPQAPAAAGSPVRREHAAVVG